MISPISVKVNNKILIVPDVSSVIKHGSNIQFSNIEIYTSTAVEFLDEIV